MRLKRETSSGTLKHMPPGAIHVLRRHCRLDPQTGLLQIPEEDHLR
jgi:hypothetical protein